MLEYMIQQVQHIPTHHLVHVILANQIGRHFWLGPMFTKHGGENVLHISSVFRLSFGLIQFVGEVLQLCECKL